MGRTAAFRQWLRVVALGEALDTRGVPSREGIEISRGARSRRDFLRTAVGGATAGLVAARAFRPGLAWAVQPSKVNAGIAVVGAGLAGLTCAWELARRGVAATVYEASDRVGGRCLSLEGVFPGQVVELGAELIDTTHSAMKGYARDLGLTLESYHQLPGETFWHLDGVLRHESEIVDEWRAFVPAIQADLRALSKQPTADHHTGVDQAYDYLDLRTYLESRGAGPILMAALDAAYTPEYGRELDEQSCLNLLFFIHADRRSKFREFGIFSDERYHVVEGTGQIPLRMAASLGSQIELGMALVALRRLATGRYVMTFDTGSGLVDREADAVVLALPFTLLRQVALDPSLELPDSKRRAIDELVYGTNAKMMVGFDARPWRTLGCTGQVYARGLTNVQNTWETNPSFRGPTAVLTDYVGGHRGESLDPSNVQAEAEGFLQALEHALPGVDAAATRLAGGAIRAMMKHWPSAPWQQGSYVCNHPGYFTTIAGYEGTRVGNLLFAGEHANSFYEWQGWMEGAVSTGAAAAKELFIDLRQRWGLFAD
jgi:monoamine oxidase